MIGSVSWELSKAIYFVYSSSMYYVFSPFQIIRFWIFVLKFVGFDLFKNDYEYGQLFRNIQSFVPRINVDLI